MCRGIFTDARICPLQPALLELSETFRPADASKTLRIHKILLIGSGPIVIGQGCEFDYSGVQACKALKEEGYTVILVNSNPATIMTDPEFAHRTYIEPITPEVVEKIIEREKPDALLPTLGGQTALNCAMKLFESGVLEKHGVKMIGANAGGDSQGRGSAGVQGGDDQDRARYAALGHARTRKAEIEDTGTAEVSNSRCKTQEARDEKEDVAA